MKAGNGSRPQTGERLSAHKVLASVSYHHKEVVMGCILTGDQLRTALKRLGDIERQLGQKEYPHDPEGLLNALQAVGEGEFKTIGGKYFPSQFLAADLIPKDKYGNPWVVVEDVLPSNFKVEDLEFVSFLKDGELRVNNETMQKRARELKANFGLVDGKRLLERQDNIPAKLRGKFLILLPGTILYDNVHDPRPPFLC